MTEATSISDERDDGLYISLLKNECGCLIEHNSADEKQSLEVLKESLKSVCVLLWTPGLLSGPVSCWRTVGGLLEKSSTDLMMNSKCASGENKLEKKRKKGFAALLLKVEHTHGLFTQNAIKHNILNYRLAHVNGNLMIDFITYYRPFCRRWTCP